MQKSKLPVLFSIIIPTFNRGYVVWKALQSLQAQTYPYWEAIVIDDGSSDDTVKVIGEFQQDQRIRYFKQEHDGVAKARNYGLQLTTGEIIGYLDSDDRFYDFCLSTVREFFQKFPDATFAIPNYNRRTELYDKDHRLLDFTDLSSAQKLHVTLQDIYHWQIKSSYGTGLFHKSVVKKESIHWDSSLNAFEDWDFVLQLGRVFPQGFLHIPYVLCEYIQKYGHDGSCSQTSYAQWAKAFDAMYQKHQHDPLMKGQTWYPSRVKKYQELQRLVDQGMMPDAMYKYFPDFAPVGKRTR